MYPRLLDFTKDLFGFEVPIPIYSFGFMVAVAILTAGWLTGRELDRKHRLGLLPGVPVRQKVTDSLGREKVKDVVEPPSALTGMMMALAALLGVAGAKLFHILENLGEFARDPAGMLFSSGGLTFYGGLIVAAVGIALYVRKKGLAVPRVADAVAPSLLLGYGIGRLGCYLAGDGDWGVCSTLAAKPAWIPGFLWSETFPRNVMGPGMTPVDVVPWTAARMQEAGMDASVCANATGVYPAMLYETLMCVAGFGLLWALRKHPYRAGWLFGVYLILAGVERFLAEAIRVNNVGSYFGFQSTQAQFISVLLALAGLVIVARTMRRAAPSDAAPLDAKPAPVTTA